MTSIIEMLLPSMSAGELDALIADAEKEKAKRSSEPVGKHPAAKEAKRDPRCPECKAALWKNGKRKSDGVQSYVCPSCGRKSCDTTDTSLHSSKVSLGKIRLITTLVMFDLPTWTVSRFAGVTEETAGCWRDRCLDADQAWQQADA